ncbi:hypothetical protein ACKFKG_03760 [Phormidesmis sp. 146-35]
MPLEELEKQLLNLTPDEKRRLIRLLTQSLSLESPLETHAPETSLVEFFRNSPLCEVAEALDLSRDQSPILDRISL